MLLKFKSKYKLNIIMYLIAEIGVNFFDISKKYKISPLDACKLMIIEAKNSGCHCVKFQSYKAETLASKNSPAYWDLNKEKTTNQYDLFKKLDSFNEEEFGFLSNFCNENGIDFISTPFDLNSVNYLDKYQKIYKISSSDITNYPLLKLVGTKKKKVLLSTGASNIEEIKKAVEILENNGCPDVIIMHCVLNYPTNNVDANIGMLNDIKNNFPNYKLGYSDHTQPDNKMLILTTAYIKGADYIEKHFTLDKSIPGNDHYHSADPQDFKIFSDNIKLLNDIMGKDIKECLQNEEKSRLNARRSIVSEKNIKKGEILTEENIICKRPGTGISAINYYDILGKKLIVDVDKDTILQLSMIGP